MIGLFHVYSPEVSIALFTIMSSKKGYEMPTAFATAFFASTVSSKESCGACRDTTLKLEQTFKEEYIRER